MKKFTDHVTVHLADTDTTGGIFFPKLFEKALIVLENFLKNCGLHKALVTDLVAFPVVCANSQYLSPLKVYDELTVEMTVTRIGQTSMSFHYKFINQDGELAAECSLVHVCVDPKTKQKKLLPDHWVEKFFAIHHA